MKVSLSWLKDYVDIEITPDELSRLLTMAGLEVEGIEAAGQSLKDIIVARIISIVPHPGADRLSLCQVDTGKETVQVVCGAPNLFEGALVPMAVPGVKLPKGLVISENRIRGEISKGMLLSEDEMGLTDDHTGIMILPSELVPGTSLPTQLPIADLVFDISITPNRPDCAGVIGVAREIAAATGKKLKEPEIKICENGPAITDLTSITIMDPEGCPRYVAGIIQDIKLGRSPFKMRYRLYLSGIRSINNVVDVTNYVLMEMGQPLHAFDYNRLKGNRIVVRRAEEGESFTTLDGKDHILNNETLMICDGEQGAALAGIMGGLNSEIIEGTKDILIESAFFDPVTIRRASKKLGLSTEASYRFERGADIGALKTAMKRALTLISSLAGGKVATGLIDNYPKPYSPYNIDLRVDKVNRILGTELLRDDINRYLKTLEMDVREIDENTFRVSPPSFRVDITREIDLIEEVARLNGYDQIPVCYPVIRPSIEEESPELQIREQIRPIMVGLGFSEIITYSFISPHSVDIPGVQEKDSLKSFVRLLNPLTIEQSVMRTSLVPGLLSSFKNNLSHDEHDLKLFEWGKIFIRKEKKEDQQPLEKPYLGAIITGLQHKKTWYGEEKYCDYYDIKGMVEALLKGLGFDSPVFQKARDYVWYEPEYSSTIFYSGSRIGHLGRIASRVMEAYDIKKENAFLFELDIQALLMVFPETGKFRPFPKFPAVYRDISIIIKKQIESAGIIEIIKQEGKELVESIHIFDLYEGKKIGPSVKALAFRICYRSKYGTLDGNEINRLHNNIIEKIRRETGGKLREG